MNEQMEQNPLTAEPKPPFPEQQQDMPGLEAKMEPRPDYGRESYKGSGRLSGKAAVITGGDSGIGRAVAVAFAREGADVLVSYLEQEEPDADETAAVIEEAGRKAVKVPGDIGDPAHCESIIEQAAGEFGRLDILVNNAAHQMVRQSITEIPVEEIDYIFRTNILAQFYLCRAAVPHMKPGSSIINSTSVQAYDPSPQLLHYAATKAAIVNFTKGLAKELTPKGIRVNAVAPGPVWTPLIAGTFSGDKVAEFGKDNPTGRPGQPVELAPAYVFLASPESSFLSGEILGVTGGMSVP